MMHHIRLTATVLLALLLALALGSYGNHDAEAASRPQGTAPAANPGAQADSAMPEALYGPSFAYLAWNLFLQAMAPDGDRLTFETWTEQCRLNPQMVGCPATAADAADQPVRRLHASVGMHAEKVPGSDCGAMTKTPLGGYPAPANLAPNASYCEEVYVSPAEAAFVKRYLLTLAGQQEYGSIRNGAINFPGTEQNESRLEMDSLEIKVDWVPSASFRKPSFACPDPTGGLYTETIHGTCYALAAVHITSKVMPNWLWATFEPDSRVVDPNRCDPKLYGTCLDPWGTTSSRPYGKGQSAVPSPELTKAMAEAHLPPAFRHYFLTGVQTQFVDNLGKPIAMGNSFIEFNQGVPPGKSSCITCHQYAAFSGKQPVAGTPEENFGHPPHGWPSVGYACNANQKGNCLPGDSKSTTQDFSWMLGLMPYGGAAAAAAAPPAGLPPHSVPAVHEALVALH